MVEAVHHDYGLGQARLASGNTGFGGIEFEVVVRLSQTLLFLPFVIAAKTNRTLNIPFKTRWMYPFVVGIVFGVVPWIGTR